MHGLVDENVHIRHSWRLVAELMRHGVRHELLVLPEERHAPRTRAVRDYMEDTVKEFLVRALRAERPKGGA